MTLCEVPMRTAPLLPRGPPASPRWSILNPSTHEPLPAAVKSMTKEEVVLERMTAA
jgi:hypothetical protein